MKKVVLSLAVIAFALVFSNKAFAQYPIPSFDVPIVADPTTFEEAAASNLLIHNSGSREEKQLNITTGDFDVETTASATVNIYAINNRFIVYGPYTVNEGTAFTISLNADYEWKVEVISCSDGCKMDVWYN